jgi:hypothetical protein
MDYLPFIAGIKGEEKTVFNGKIVKYVSIFCLMSCFQTYININTPEFIDDIKKSMVENIDRNIEGKNGNIEEDIEDVEDEYEENYDSSVELLNKVLKKLIVTYVDLSMPLIKEINVDSEQLEQFVLKTKNKERSGIVKKMEQLSLEARKVEFLKKKHKLGDWSIGLDSAIWMYDEEQYDRERSDWEKNTRMEISNENLDEVTRAQRELYYEYEMEQDRMENEEIMENYEVMHDDDDYGDMDGDEMY